MNKKTLLVNMKVISDLKDLEILVHNFLCALLRLAPHVHFDILFSEIMNQIMYLK